MVADKTLSTRVRFDIPFDPAKFRALRVAKMLTQDEFADASGISRPTVAALETGGRSPSVEMLRRLCRALGCDPGDLVSYPAADAPALGAAPRKRPPPVKRVTFSG